MKEERTPVMRRGGGGRYITEYGPHNGDEAIHEEEHTDLSHVTSFEDLLNIVGTKGRWNLLIFLLCSYTSFISALQSLSYQFLGATPDHWCYIETLVEAGWTQKQVMDFAIPLDKDGKCESCLMYDRNYTLAALLGYEVANSTLQDAESPIISCYARDFNRAHYQSTVTTEWDLVCERRAIYSTTQAAAQIGRFVGCIFLGYLADMYGRRLMVLLCCVLVILTTFASAIAPTVGLYIFLRVAITVATSGIFLGTFVLMMENSGMSERTRMGTLSAWGWSTGYVCVPAIAYFIRNWKFLQTAYSLASLVLIAYYWFLPESPRWLIQQGKDEEAVTALKWAARVNRRTLPPEPALLEAMQRIRTQVFAEQGNKANEVVGMAGEGSRWRQGVQWATHVIKDYLAVLWVKEMRCRALVVFFCWFTCGMVYYGISLSATNISVNVYLYVLLGGLMEFPVYLALWPMVSYFGRVKSLAMLLFLCGLSIFVLALVIYFFPDANNGLIMFVSLVGKIGITGAFTLIWMFTLELFPTKYRSNITSQASVSARIGSISSPYINDILGDLVVWAPSAMFCALALVTGSLSFFLPETKGRGMPEGYSFSTKQDENGTINQAYIPDVESTPEGTTEVPTKVQDKV